MLADGKVAWKLLVISNNKNAFLKIASLFQSASNHDQPHQLTVLESESHELFKNAIKKLSFDWYGGLPAGFIIWKISNFYFGHRVVKMIRTD